MDQNLQVNDKKKSPLRNQINEQEEFLVEDQMYEDKQNQVKKNQGKILQQKKNFKKEQKLKKSKIAIFSKISGITRPKATRPIDKKIQFTLPSPVRYQPTQLPSNHTVTIPKASNQKSRHNKQNQKVGPGSYFYQQQKDNNTQPYNYTIGWKYDSIFDVKDKSNPGPGDYVAMNELIEHRSKNKSKSIAQNTGFGTSHRFQIKPSNPGPAEYQNLIKSHVSINKIRTISNVGRQDAYKQQKIPGPGYYEKISEFESSLQKGKCKGITIGLQKNNRLSLPNITTQSYNKYTIVRDFDSINAPAYSIGKQKRRFQDVNQNPSPNEYLPIRPVGHSPSASLTRASQTQKEEQAPGPGSYQKLLLHSSIKYSIGKSKSISTLKTGSHSPGVGRYNIADQFIKNKYKNKGSLFCREKRMQESIVGTAGVGDYNIGNSQSSFNKGITIPKAQSKRSKN